MRLLCILIQEMYLVNDFIVDIGEIVCITIAAYLLVYAYR